MRKIGGPAVFARGPRKGDDAVFYVMLADGFEETEAIVPLDLLRRAGVDAKTVGVTGQVVTGSHGICVRADLLPEQADPVGCEGVFLPGGMPGMENLFASGYVCDAVRVCAEAGVPVAAICAAPSVLGRLGLLQGKEAVCYPGFERELIGRVPSTRFVCTDGNVITAQGAGCVFPFSHALITALKDGEAADRVMRDIRYADL